MVVTGVCAYVGVLSGLCSLSHFDVCSISSGLLDGPEEKGNAKLQDLEYILQCISNKTMLQSL